MSPVLLLLGLLIHVLEPPHRPEELRVWTERLGISQNGSQGQGNYSLCRNHAAVEQDIVLIPKLLLHGRNGGGMDAKDFADHGKDIANVAGLGVVDDL